MKLTWQVMIIVLIPIVTAIILAGPRSLWREYTGRFRKWRNDRKGWNKEITESDGDLFQCGGGPEKMSTMDRWHRASCAVIHSARSAETICRRDTDWRTEE